MLFVLSARSASGQDYDCEVAEEPGVEIGRWRSAIVIESPVPAFFG